MNKSRRKEIMAVIKKLNGISDKIQKNEKEDMLEELEDVIGDVQNILDDEMCYMENIPENLQGGERYERAEEACDSLESAVDVLEYISEDDSVKYITDTINKAVDYLRDAM